MPDKVIVKEGQGAIQDFLGTISKKTKGTFRGHLFETIFGAIGPMLGWKMFGWKIGLLIYLAEYVGFGVGRIGRLIDNEINWKPGQSLSLSSLKDASSSVVDKIKGLVGLKANSMLTEMMEIKGTIDDHDLIAIAYMDKYFPEKEIMKKEAIGRGGYFRKFLRAVSGGKKLGFANALYGLLKLFAGGLAGLGIVGVVGGLAKRNLGIDVPEATPIGGRPGGSSIGLPSTQKAPTSGGNLYIVNEKGNVEDTLIYFLNANIDGFSQAFAQVNKRPLKGSPVMRSRLAVIEKLNGKKLWKLNKEKSFLIPPIMLIARTLLPEARYEKIGKPAPVAKPVVSPIGKDKASAKKLEELLQGAK